MSGEHRCWRSWPPLLSLESACLRMPQAFLMSYALVCPPPPTPAQASLCAGADETPLLYGPRIVGTYTVEGESKQVTVLGSREKRACSGTPVTSRSGEIILFQVIFKGTTERCHPEGDAPPKMYFDHAKAKNQTAATWMRLLEKVCF